MADNTEQPVADKYHFSDFTRVEYRKHIRLAKESYLFRSYSDFNMEEKFVIWRHDLDFSVHAAKQAAIIEHEEGVKATYFLLPHSEFYSIFEKEIVLLVKEIIAMGHDIGLHFDTHFYGIEDESMLEHYLTREKRWLKELFDVDVRVFSFHNTTSFTMNCKEWEYAGLINTYAKRFQEEFAYCSDSNGYWRYDRLGDVLMEAKAQRLQVLTHPEWWQETVMSPKKRIERCIEGRASNALSYYNELLNKMDRSNIDDK